MYLYLTRDTYKEKIYLVFGFLLGIMMLLRPIAVVFVPVFIMVILFDRISLLAKIRHMSVIIFLAFLVILPWNLYIYQNWHRFVFLSTDGVPTMRDGFSFNSKSYRHQIHLDKNIKQLSDSFASQNNNIHTYGEIFNFLIKESKINSIGVIKFYLFKAGRSFYGLDSQDPKGELANMLVCIPLVLIFFAGIVFARADNVLFFNNLRLISVFSVFGLWFTTITFFSILRYMTPTFGFMIIMDSYFIYSLIDHKSN
jgi:4-amino-4-deoxy-L-arabinose transferase-like glycosyltransferase